MTAKHPTRTKAGKVHASTAALSLLASALDGAGLSPRATFTRVML